MKKKKSPAPAPAADLPAPSYSIEEIVRATGVTPRTLRHWTARGVLEPPPFQGALTRYRPEHLARIRAIQELRRQGLPLGAIRAQLARAAAPSPPAAPVSSAASPPPAPPPSPADAVLAEPPGLGRPPPPAPAYPAERWERLVLAPGLELHVNLAGGALLRRVAQEIFAHYGPLPGESLPGG